MEPQNPVRIMKKSEHQHRFISCLHQDKSGKKNPNRKGQLFRMVGLDKTFMQVDIAFNISTDYNHTCMNTQSIQLNSHPPPTPPPLTSPQKKPTTKLPKTFATSPVSQSGPLHWVPPHLQSSFFLHGNLTCITVWSAALSSTTSPEQLLSPWQPHLYHSLVRCTEFHHISRAASFSMATSPVSQSGPLHWVPPHLQSSFFLHGNLTCITVWFAALSSTTSPEQLLSPWQPHLYHSLVRCTEFHHISRAASFSMALADPCWFCWHSPSCWSIQRFQSSPVRFSPLSFHLWQYIDSTKLS